MGFLTWHPSRKTPFLFENFLLPPPKKKKKKKRAEKGHIFKLQRRLFEEEKINGDWCEEKQDRGRKVGLQPTSTRGYGLKSGSQGRYCPGDYEILFLSHRSNLLAL